ncbi:hypothetical protein TIFTF001_010396 [Ficus carica]|uniref:Macro domain-containing protein n=1 Tax=Ficus carica TaxID=3494 RepID=A0AA87ZQ13_FICCA|nr:hypothetical protein TIFTF001_010396 [Ficus carica]
MLKGIMNYTFRVRIRETLFLVLSFHFLRIEKSGGGPPYRAVRRERPNDEHLEQRLSTGRNHPSFASELLAIPKPLQKTCEHSSFSPSFHGGCFFSVNRRIGDALPSVLHQLPRHPERRHHQVVNPADERMLGGGGADGAIHSAAGPDLLLACYSVPEVIPGVRCPTGEARITPGFKLPVAHVVFTVGPIYDGNSTVEASLRSAYRNSLKVAKENNIQYIAFPAVSCGVFGYPYDEAATIAISTIKEFVDDIKEVHFVLYHDEIYHLWLNKANELLQA